MDYVAHLINIYVNYKTIKVGLVVVIAGNVITNATPDDVDHSCLIICDIWCEYLKYYCLSDSLFLTTHIINGIKNIKTIKRTIIRFKYLVRIILIS